MGATKQAIAIDGHGHKVAFIVTRNGHARHYTLKDGESIVHDDIQTALAMVRPRWDGDKWVEMATDNEIETARAKRRRAPEEQRPGEMGSHGQKMDVQTPGQPFASKYENLIAIVDRRLRELGILEKMTHSNLEKMTHSE